MAKTDSTNPTATLATKEELDELLGFLEALDEQRQVIWEARAIVLSVAEAFGAHDRSSNWPADLPNFPLALRRAGKILDEAAGALECGVLKERGSAIVRSRREEASDG